MFLQGQSCVLARVGKSFIITKCLLFEFVLIAFLLVKIDPLGTVKCSLLDGKIVYQSFCGVPLV